MMQRRFVVMTGLPGSGKSQLAQQLAPRLGLPVLDKDAWLEHAFEAKGSGDEAWRRRLSREADTDFQHDAQTSAGAILVSFWHQQGMASDSGTPTEWLRHLNAAVVVVNCVCAPELAVDRFVRRQRHAGHLDYLRSPTALLDQFRFLASLDTLDVGTVIAVSTTQAIDVEAVCSGVTVLFADRVYSLDLWHSSSSSPRRCSRRCPCFRGSRAC